MSFRLKIILGIALIEAALLSLLIWNNLSSLKSSNEAELLRHATSTARMFSATTKDAVLAMDLASLESFVQTLLHNPGIVYARVLGPGGVVFAEGGMFPTDNNSRPFDTHLDGVTDGIFDTRADITEAGVNFGRVELGISIDSYLQALARTKRYAYGIALVEMGLVALFSFVLGTYLTRQLTSLMRGSERIAAGALGYQIPVVGNDELAQTATAFNNMSEQLRDNSLKQAAILQSALDCIVTLDQDGRVTEFNPAAERVFGYTRNEVLGRHLVDVIRPTNMREYDDHDLRHFLETGEATWLGQRIETTASRADGTTLPIELAVIETRESDHPVFFTAYIRDITERRRNDQLKRQFVSTVSHELRTPLTAVQGALGLIASGNAGNLPKQAEALVAIADNNCRRLIRIINDILDIEKIESGTMEFEFRPLEVRQLVHRACVDNSAYADLYRVRIVVDEPLPDVRLYADEARLLQVMANLLSNAVKFSPRNGLVRVSVHRAADTVRVAVADRGNGIPEEFRTRIFEKFAQADASDSRERSGTGLGLSISKMIVEEHKGTIGFESKTGIGTIFYFDLPPYTASPQGAALAPRESSG